MTVSLAEGGAGLGTGWGEQVARRLLADAGFGPVEVHDALGTQAMRSSSLELERLSGDLAGYWSRQD